MSIIIITLSTCFPRAFDWDPSLDAHSRYNFRRWKSVLDFRNFTARDRKGNGVAGKLWLWSGIFWGEWGGFYQKLKRTVQFCFNLWKCEVWRLIFLSTIFMIFLRIILIRVIHFFGVWKVWNFRHLTWKIIFHYYYVEFFFSCEKLGKICVLRFENVKFGDWIFFWRCTLSF